MVLRATGDRGMTTIACRKTKNGYDMACDSMESINSEGGGARFKTCDKIYRKKVTDPFTDDEYEVLIGTAGESSPALVLVDWFPGCKWLMQQEYELMEEYPEILLHLDGECDLIIVEPDGIYEMDVYARPVKIDRDFWAVGSGSKCALTAMELGLAADKAVQEAIKFDTYSIGPTKVERLKA